MYPPVGFNQKIISLYLGLQAKIQKFTVVDSLADIIFPGMLTSESKLHIVFHFKF